MNVSTRVARGSIQNIARTVLRNSTKQVIRPTRCQSTRAFSTFTNVRAEEQQPEKKEHFVANTFNRVTLLGRIGADPVERVINNETPVINFSVATDSKYDRETKQSSAMWHRVVVYDAKVLHTVKTFCQKGSLVYVEGRLKSNEYTTKTGQHVNSYSIVATGVKVVSGRMPEQNKD